MMDFGPVPGPFGIRRGGIYHLKEYPVTSGNPNDISSASALSADEELCSEQFDAAYGASSAATLVIRPPRRVLYYNKQAKNLFPSDGPAPRSIEDLDTGHPDDTDTLVALIDNAARPPISPLRWNGPLAGLNASDATVFINPLPADEPLLVCRIRLSDSIAEQMHNRLFRELTVARRQRLDLNDTGYLLVETIHDLLNTPTVIQWRAGDEETRTWCSGDQEFCHQMASSTSDLIDELPATPGMVRRDDDRGTVAMRLKTGEHSSALLLMATGSQGRILDGSSQFWKHLATTCEAALQRARLLETSRRRRQRLRAVIEQMPMAVLLFDTHGNILDLNLRARAMVDRRNWEHIIDNDPPYEVYDTDGNLLPREHWPLIRAVRTGDVCEDEDFVLDFGTRRRTVSLTIVPITEDTGHVRSYLATGRDVTQRSEKERRRDEFLSIASHELRNPLTPLTGLLHMAYKQAEADEPVETELLERARSQVQRLKRLIEGLLDVSRLQTGKLPIRRQPTCIGRLVQKVMAPWLNGEHGERIELQIPNDTIEAHVDPDRIDQVVTNVVDNAIKHGRDDGTVTVILDKHDGDGDEQVVLTIEDEGDGIPHEIIDRVFDRYVFTTEPSSSGAGLGLYIARQIVEDHDGHISIDSGPGRPTCIEIMLPVSE